MDPHSTPPSPLRAPQAQHPPCSPSVPADRAAPPRWRDEDIPAATSPEYWPAFFKAVHGQPPRDTLLRALAAFDMDFGHAADPGSPAAVRQACPCHPDALGVALDLACGQGRDTLELLRRRWCVLAIDSHPLAISQLLAHVPAESAHLLRTGVESMEELPLPPNLFDLVNASFAVPHIPPASFGAVWARIAASVKPGGRFAGQFFGTRDQWSAEPDGLPRTFHTRAQVLSLLHGFDLEHLDEVERPGHDAFGRPRHWHVFHVVARKHR